VSVVTTQTFDNPTTVAMQARYVFPLPTDAAVYGMQMQVGDEVIEAVIQEAQQAQRTFDQAQREGRSAALVSQQRANVFTQDVANLAPGLPITVVLRYQFTLGKSGGEYELALPFGVGPRFDPAGAAHEPNLMSANVAASAVSVSVNLAAGLPVFDLASPTHELDLEWSDETRCAVTSGVKLDADGVLDDFVLRFRLGGDDIDVGLVSGLNNGEGAFAMRLEPPEQSADADITRREIVFVLDTSGSMRGVPLDASRDLAREILHTLRADDHFRIVQFGSNATEFSSTPMLATSANVSDGVRYLNSLEGMGGTEMVLGVRQALAPETIADAVRMVVFLTDGYIGSDSAVLAEIEQHRGDARLFAFGVGDSVNRMLLEEMGRVGHGFSRIMTHEEEPAEVVAQLHARLQSPVLTNIEIDWHEVRVSDVVPTHIPDLFEGQTLTLHGRYDEAQSAPHMITVNGLVAGRPTSFDVPVTLSASLDAGGALNRAWARHRIAETMQTYRMASAGILPWSLAAEAQAHVTAMGLEHELVTQWTSFVAVSRRVVAPNEEEAEVGRRSSLLDQPERVLRSFMGSSAPEPATWLGVLSLCAAGAAARRRREEEGEDE
jgi:Ca-activated chloride channel family protein